MYKPASNKSVQNIHRVEKFSIAQARWKFSRIRRVSFTESSRFLENDSSARYTCDEWRSRCATRVHEPRLVTETGHRGERRKASRGSEECRKEGTYVRTMSMVEKFYRVVFWLRHRKTEGRKRRERGVEEEYADPSKDEREVQRRLRKPVSVRDNRGASDWRLSGVWRRRDAPRAARHSRRDNESSLPYCSWACSLSLPLSLSRAHTSPFPSPLILISLSRTFSLRPVPSVWSFLRARGSQRSVYTLWSSGVTLAERRVNRRETEKGRETEREKLGSSSRRRRHTASLCARLRLGTLASLFVYWSSPLRTSMHIHSTVTHTYEVYKDGVV